MRKLALVAILLAVTAGLAGCASDEEGLEPTRTNNSTGPTLEEPNVSFNGTDVYAYETESTDEIRYENDSFSPATCFSCPGSEHRFDVTSMLPSGAPSLLTAEVNTSSRILNGVTIDLEVDGAEVYEANESFQDLRAVVEPAGGTVEIVVENLAPDARTSIDYSLRIQVQSNRTVFPSEVPIALPVPEEPAGLVVEPEQLEGEPRLMLWDGEDNFLGHQPIADRTTINVSQAEGEELVGYLAGADGIARVAPVNASATDTTMRPLGVAENEAATGVSSGNVTVEPNIERVPIQVGLFIRGSNDAGTEYSGRLVGPNGTLVSHESGGFFTGPGGEFRFLDDPGAAGLLEGDYAATFEFSQATGGEAGALWWTYER